MNAVAAVAAACAEIEHCRSWLHEDGIDALECRRGEGAAERVPNPIFHPTQVVHLRVDILRGKLGTSVLTAAAAAIASLAPAFALASADPLASTAPLASAAPLAAGTTTAITANNPAPGPAERGGWYPCWGSLLPLQEELLCPELSGVQTPTSLPTSVLVPQSVAVATGLA